MSPAGHPEVGGGDSGNMSQVLGPFGACRAEMVSKAVPCESIDIDTGRTVGGGVSLSFHLLKVPH